LRQRLDGLVARDQEALKRADKFGPPPAPGTAGAIPWANDAVEYLERRQSSGLSGVCTLPELFSYIRGKEPELTLSGFHIGIRRLHDRGAVRLLPHEDPEGPPEPEYALLDGPAVYWYAAC
jgi:hypothetical protein